MKKCLICKRKFKTYSSLIKHLRTHKISSQQYYDRYCRNYARDEGFCLECGKETNFYRFGSGYNKHCSLKCSTNSNIVKEKQKQTCLNRYGVKNVAQNNTIKERMKLTWLRKYGVEFPSQSKIIKEKKKETSLKNFGVVHPMKNNKIKEKIKKTCLEKYGVENPYQAGEIKEKIKQTCLERYGVENPTQSKQIQEKIKQTCLERYGVESPLQSKQIKNKMCENGIFGTKNNKPLFNFYAPKIGWAEETRKTKEGYLEVRCKKCNKWFIPDLRRLYHRIQALNGNYSGEYNLYCSDKCKNSCSIFRQKLYKRNQNPNPNRPWHSEWSLEVKRIANYECEICGSKNDLIAHHIEPVKLRPDLQADIDNGICLCSICHSKYGHKDECSTGNLARMVC